MFMLIDKIQKTHIMKIIPKDKGNRNKVQEVLDRKFVTKEWVRGSSVRAKTMIVANDHSRQVLRAERR